MVWLSLLLSLLVVRDSWAQEVPPQAIEAEIVTAPVTLDGVVLFHVRGVSSYSADKRADLISGRIAAAAADPVVRPEDVRVESIDNAIRIDAGDQTLMAVIEADARLEHVAATDLARAHASRIGQAIGNYRQARSPDALWRSGVRTATATLLLLMGTAVLIWFWRWFDGVLGRRMQARIHSVGIQSFEVMRAEQIRAALHNTLLVIRVILFSGLALVYAGYVLAQWPATHELSHGVAGLALDPLRTLMAGFVRNIPRLAFLAVLLILVRVILRVTRLFFEAVGRGTVRLGGFDREWAGPTYKLVRVGIVAFGLIVAYPHIPGSESDAFKGVSLFIGIVFSLGSSSSIANIIAGYMMTYRRAFKVGDRVKIGEAVGDVIEARLQVTHLRSPKNEEIIIPNSEILSGQVLNYNSLSKTHALLLHIEVRIGYATSWRHIEAILLDAASRTPGLAAEPIPFVWIKSLGEFAVTYELNAPCGDVKTMLATYTRLHQNVLDVFNEHGVQIMTPAYEGDPPEPKLVPLKDLYAPPPKAPSPRPETVAPGNRPV